MDSTHDRKIRSGTCAPAPLVPGMPPAVSPSPRKACSVPTSARQPLGRSVHVRDPRGIPDLPVERGRRAEDYEFQIVTVPPRTSVGQVRAQLTEEAEYGRWELARTRRYLGGGKKVWTRRRIIRVRSTPGEQSGA